MRFEIVNNYIYDNENKQTYEILEEVCNLLNEQEEERMEYKRKLKSLKFRMQKVIEVEDD